MINIQWTKFEQKSIGSFISGELPEVPGTGNWSLGMGKKVKKGNEIKISRHHLFPGIKKCQNFFVNFEHVHPDPARAELVTISRLQMRF